VVSRSVRENRPKVNRSESVDASLGFWVVWRSCRVGDSRGCRVGRLSSDGGGGDRLESLIFAIELLILINLIVILMILISLTIILMIVLMVRENKSWWKTLYTGALAVTRDIRGYPNYPDG
jgi:hypothetical protein